jgi:hypothetical protein
MISARDFAGLYLDETITDHFRPVAACALALDSRHASISKVAPNALAVIECSDASLNASVVSSATRTEVKRRGRRERSLRVARDPLRVFRKPSFGGRATPLGLVSVDLITAHFSRGRASPPESQRNRGFMATSARAVILSSAHRAWLSITQLNVRLGL